MHLQLDPVADYRSLMPVSALLPASLGALVIGPLLSRYARSRPSVIAFVDGFIVVSIGGLVLLDVVPHALEHRDLIAMLCMALGYLVPGLVERMLQYGVRQTHTAILGLALLGVAVHSVLDGSALAQSHTQPGSLLGYGVLLHQIPVGLTVWWVLRDRARLMSWLVLLLMAIMTVAGYVAEPTVLAWLPDRAALWFEALVGGSLLHVIGHATHEHEEAEAETGHAHSHADHSHQQVHAHSHDHDGHAHSHEHDPTHAVPTGDLARASGIGSLLGLAVLVALQLLGGRGHDEQSVSIADSLWELTLAGAPAVLFAYGAIAVLATVEQVRGRPVFAWGPGSVRVSDVRSGNGALSLEAALLSVPLLGVALALIRLLLAQVLTTLTARSGVVPVERIAVASPERQQPHTAWISAVEYSAPWIIVGLMTAAILPPILAESWLTRLPAGVDVLVFAVFGGIICVHAAALVPVGAVLIAAGVSPGAALALLLLGALPDLRAWLPVVRSRGTAAAARAWAIAPTIAILAGLALNAADDRIRSGAWSGLSAGPSNGLTLAAAGLVALLYVWVLARRGIRGFLEPLHISNG
ncbi:hypothetical membrane protein [Gemmatimonas aurantiaca T-27]|nr:hypothetical membrane protein [Gemmatimonas aurantiaca T-27]